MEATTTNQQEASMAAKHTYTVKTQDGKAHTRTTHRTYTNAVAVQDLDKGTWGVVAWCGRLDLAAKEANRWRRGGHQAEVLVVPQATDTAAGRRANSEARQAARYDEAPAAPQAAPVQAPNALGTDHLAGQYKAYVAAQLALKAHKANGTTDSAEAAAAQGTMDSLRSGYRAYRKLQAQARAARKGEGAAPAAPQPKPAKAPKPVQYVGGEGEYTVLLDGVPTLQMRKRSESYSGIQGSNGRPLGTYSYWDVWALLPGSYVPGKKYSGMSTGPKLASETTRQRALAAATAKLAQA